MIETSVVIPSYRRPRELEQAIRSVLAQQGIEAAAPFEIIVVDNDAERSAEAVVARFAGSNGGSPDDAAPVRYVHEPRPGISHARNTGVAAATGRYLAFLDDDEQVGPGWLAAFLAALRHFDADAAVGPVYPRFPPAAAVHAYCRQIYTRDARVPTGTVLPHWNIGNSIFVRERCFGATAAVVPFDPRLALTGGEDTVFLRQLTRGGGGGTGRRLIWCAEAVAWETIPADRVEPRYLVRRVFRGAQTATYVCAAVRPREWRRAARMMAGGCAQLAFWGLAALALRLRRRQQEDPRWLPVTAKAAAGLGKLLWHPRLHLRLYR